MSRCHITKKAWTNIWLRRQTRKKKYRQFPRKNPAYSLNQQPQQTAPVWTRPKNKNEKKLLQNRIKICSTKHQTLSGRNFKMLIGPKIYSPQTSPSLRKSRQAPSYFQLNWTQSTLIVPLVALSPSPTMRLGATYSRAFLAVLHNRTLLRRPTRRQVSRLRQNLWGTFLRWLSLRQFWKRSNHQKTRTRAHQLSTDLTRSLGRKRNSVRRQRALWGPMSHRQVSRPPRSWSLVYKTRQIIYTWCRERSAHRDICHQQLRIMSTHSRNLTI